jgi:NADH dehydrogenase
MKIALTGANSSVGKTLLRHVAEQADIDAVAGVRAQQAVGTLPTSPRITPRVIRYDVDALTPVFEGVSCVVHLAGILIESKTSDYQTANVAATQTVVDACRRAHVNHIVFISVLGADPGAVNRYFRSKGDAERVVAGSGISSTIIRTPILLGPETAGARALVGLASQTSVKVLGGGHYSMRPLDVDDLSRAILRCCRTQADGVATHELVGPEPTTYRDLIRKTGRLIGHDVSVGSVPVWTAKLGAAIVSRIRGGGMTPTVVDVITANETVRKNADIDLGVTLTPLSVTLEHLLPTRTDQS